MDRISGLPDFIVHHILSFLPYKEAAQTSILSKLWLHSWSTYPLLYFRQQYFGIDPAHPHVDVEKCQRIMEEKMEKFLNFVDKTLTRYHAQKLCIREFALFVNMLKDCNYSSLVDQWIDTVMENHVELFSLSIWHKDFSYSWPQKMIMPKCDSLNSLHLHRIRFDEFMFQKLISSCHLIETFVLDKCEGLKRIHVVNLHRLKNFLISVVEETVVVEIDAPSRQSFAYVSQAQCALNIIASVNLRRLSLRSVSFTHMFLQYFIAKFPILESLTLFGSTTELERVDISCHSLKHLDLRWRTGPLQAKIDAPNLLSIDYIGEKIPSLSFTNRSDHSLKIQVTKYLYFRLDTSWFLELKEFLGNLNHVEVSLKFPTLITVHEFSTDRYLREIRVPPTHEVEHMEIDSSVLKYPVLVNCLFWCCHPKYLSVLRSSDKFDNEFLKFVSEKLMISKDADFCTSPDCWCHHLQDAEVESFNGIKDGEYRHWKTLVDAWPTLPWGKKVGFRLKWK